MTQQTTKLHIPDLLKSDEACRLYLEACFKDAGEDSAFLAAALRDVARAKAIDVSDAITFAEAMNVATSVGLRLAIRAAHAL